MLWLIYKLKRLHLIVMHYVAMIVTHFKDPVLLRAYAEIQPTGASGFSRQPYKGFDLIRLLRKHQPKKIIEMGSGTTTAVFVHFAKQTGAECISYEHSPVWADSANKALLASGLVTKDKNPVKLVEMYIA